MTNIVKSAKKQKTTVIMENKCGNENIDGTMTTAEKRHTNRCQFCYFTFFKYKIKRVISLQLKALKKIFLLMTRDKILCSMLLFSIWLPHSEYATWVIFTSLLLFVDWCYFCLCWFACLFTPSFFFCDKNLLLFSMFRIVELFIGEKQFFGAIARRFCYSISFHITANLKKNIAINLG